MVVEKSILHIKKLILGRSIASARQPLMLLSVERKIMSPLIVILIALGALFLLVGVFVYLKGRKRCPIDGSTRCPHCVYDQDPPDKS
jgi:hypothetical protein